MSSRTVLRVLVVALGLGMGMSCLDKKPPGPDEQQLSPTVKLPRLGKQADVFVVAKRFKHRRQYSGRGGCGSYSVYHVRYQLVRRTGKKVKRVELARKDGGDTTKLPRFQLKPSLDGVCIAYAHEGSTTWRLVRFLKDHEVLHVRERVIKLAAGGPSPCDQAAPVRQVFFEEVEKRNPLDYNTRNLLVRFLVKHPEDDGLYRAFVGAVLNAPKAYRATYISEEDLPALQRVICGKPPLVAELRRHLKGSTEVASFAYTNAALLVERCADSASQEALCTQLSTLPEQGELEEGNYREINAQSLARLTEARGQVSPACLRELSQAFVKQTLGSAVRLHLLRALAALKELLAREAIEKFVKNSGGPKAAPKAPPWPKTFDSFLERVSNTPIKRREQLAFGWAAAILKR